MGKLFPAVARGGGGNADQDRLQLSVALTQMAEARRAVDNAAAARSRSLVMVDAASDRLASATAGVTAARDALARASVVAATEGTRLAPDSEMRNARAEEQDAEDSLSAARAALAAVEARVEGPMDILTGVERRVAELSRVILSRHIEPTIADIKRQRDALFASISVLHFLQGACCDWSPDPNSEWSRLRRHLQIPAAQRGVSFEINYDDNRAAADRWASYADELKVSVDAAPPGA
jgi:hypothetical protein